MPPRKRKASVKTGVEPSYMLPTNVYEAAVKRIHWVFDEFERPAVSWSGGKDSTVVLEIALAVARERGRLPLDVYWLDQECEYQATVAYAREVAARPDVRFHWYQVPFRLFNATSSFDTWANVWGEGEEWVREKEPGAIHENTFGVDRFTEVLNAIGMQFDVTLTGVRAEESPARRIGLTSYPSYKWATWGAKAGRTNTVRLHPIYDWTFRDVWKAIHVGGWTYNSIYDEQYRYGVRLREMRVSNYHHETALASLFWLQEVEPETWEAATRRLPGIATAGQIGKEDYFPTEVPFMFSGWEDYFEYLVQHLPATPEDEETYRNQFTDLVRRLWYEDRERIAQACVMSLIANDLYFSKLNQFYVMHHRTDRDLRAAGLIDEHGNRVPQGESA